ncbi:phage tail protein [Streptomyces sp. HC307]|uniref:phage tail protein n=1 Tax=Streptomyces flavusporus TaxID=3385496 RepID=UPI0039173EBD
MLGNQVLPRLEGFFNFARDNQGLLIGLGVAITALGGAFSIAAIGVWAMNSAMLANPIFWIVAGAVAAIAGAVTLIVLYWDDIKAVTLTAWDWVVAKLVWAKDGILAAISWLGQIPEWVEGWFGDAKDWAVQKFTELTTWLSGLPGRAKSALSALGTNLAAAARSSFTSFRTAASSKVSDFLEYIRGLPGRIVRNIGSLSNLLVGAGRDVVRGLYNGVVSMGSWLRSQLIGFAKSMIPGPIAKALGIASPSRVMRDQIGRWIPAGIVEGIESGAGAVDRSMSNLVSVPTAGQATAANVAASTAGGAVAGGGSGPLRIELSSRDNGGAADLVVALLRNAVGVRGGNVQFAVTGRTA